MFSLLKAGHKRTLFLAILATVTFVGSAIFMFDVEKQELLKFFVISIVALVVVIIAALVLSGVIVLLRRLFAS
ncbi:MAG: hypothetical protein ACJA0N_000236 [Pseudohongiellaceae bacterium]|jgi:hypothetical protein